MSLDMTPRESVCAYSHMSLKAVSIFHPTHYPRADYFLVIRANWYKNIHDFLWTIIKGCDQNKHCFSESGRTMFNVHRRISFMLIKHAHIDHVQTHSLLSSSYPVSVESLYIDLDHLSWFLSVTSHLLMMVFMIFRTDDSLSLSCIFIHRKLQMLFIKHRHIDHIKISFHQIPPPADWSKWMTYPFLNQSETLIRMVG